MRNAVPRESFVTVVVPDDKKADFEAFVGILELRVRFIPLEQFLDKISEAKVLAPHLKDVEYFALALKLDCPIWAQEKAFKKQSGVKVFATSDLFPLLFEL